LLDVPLFGSVADPYPDPDPPDPHVRLVVGEKPRRARSHLHIVCLPVNVSLRWVNNVSCLFFVLPANHKWSKIVHDKVDWLAACVALRMVGAVLVVLLWLWRKICTILQPMGCNGRYLKKCPNPV
jgi:hypothetical protein